MYYCIKHDFWNAFFSSKQKSNTLGNTKNNLEFWKYVANHILNGVA